VGPLLRAAARAIVGLAGAAALAVGASALSKLGDEHLDSPRWFFTVAGLVSIGAGLGLVWIALFGLRARRPRG
jgi:drug/metabolite transporter (DMT)-like permease